MSTCHLVAFVKQGAWVGVRKVREDGLINSSGMQIIYRSVILASASRLLLSALETSMLPRTVCFHDLLKIQANSMRTQMQLQRKRGEWHSHKIRARYRYGHFTTCNYRHMPHISTSGRRRQSNSL